MKNYGLQRFKKATVRSFTSDFGIILRRHLNPILRPVLRMATKGTLHIDRYPQLSKGKSYIFVAAHNFCEDTIATLSTIDRNAYVLFGTTDQLEYNPQVYAAWLNGFIYVDRENKESRKTSIAKMERILNAGSSVLVFAEGGFNNTENLLCQRLFASPYILARSTGVEVVPVAPFYEFGSKDIFMNVGDPIDLARFEDKNAALETLRDALATLIYENIENHASRLKREQLGENVRLEYMEQRRQEYLKNKWHTDVWEEELTIYRSPEERESQAVAQSMDNIIVTKRNAYIMAPILAQRAEDRKYDFLVYMKANWDKPVVRGIE